MKPQEYDKKLGGLIYRAIGSEEPIFDFDKWKQDHQGEIQVFKSQTEKTRACAVLPSIWRIIMKKPIVKLTVAAVIVLGLYLGVRFLGGPDMANVAWAEVTRRVAAVDYAHVYYFKSRDNVLGRHFESWYAHGKLVICGNEGDMTYDNGQTLQGFDKQKRRTVKRPSNFAGGQTLFELFTGGLLSDKNEQFSRQLPAQVGDDFLIYKFDPSPKDSDFIEGIFITVGRNSLLPVQVKVYDKDSDYDLIMFDYEATEKPAEFFEPPAVEPPHGRGTVLLDGQETMIDIAGSNGIKAAVVRLHGKSSDNSDEPAFSIDVAFIVEEGYRSTTNALKRLHLNEAIQCGLGADDWPDGKYRNIRFSPLLKPTDRADTYIVEIRCWLRTETD